MRRSFHYTQFKYTLKIVTFVDSGDWELTFDNMNLEFYFSRKRITSIS